jgi:glycerol uptake facilitator-like aquaporin
VPTLKQNLIAEAMGSFFLVVAAIGSCILARDVLHADLALTVLINAISVAAVLFALIETFGAVSGSHFNPAVTLALFASKQVTKKKAATYMTAQFAGGFLGLLVTQLMFYDTNPVILVISDNTKTLPLLLSEFIGTFLLIGVIIGCVRGGSKHTGLSVAYVVGGMLIATSSTMFANPMVTFCRMFTYAICGLAPVSAVLFIIAEVAGALTAAYVFSIIYPTKLKDKCDPYDCKSDRPIRIDGLGP